MKNIYIAIYTKFYFFARKINPDDDFAAISAVGMMSALPFLNIFIILVGFFKIDYRIYRNLDIVLTILFSSLNLYLFVLRKFYLKIDSDAYSKTSKFLSNLIVISYILFSFLLFFIV